MTRARSGMKSSNVPFVTVEMVTWSAPTVWLEPEGANHQNSAAAISTTAPPIATLTLVESFRVSTTSSMPLPVTGRSPIFFCIRTTPMVMT